MPLNYRPATILMLYSRQRKGVIFFRSLQRDRDNMSAAHRYNLCDLASATGRGAAARLLPLVNRAPVRDLSAGTGRGGLPIPPRQG